MLKLREELLCIQEYRALGMPDFSIEEVESMMGDAIDATVERHGD